MRHDTDPTITQHFGFGGAHESPTPFVKHGSDEKITLGDLLCDIHTLLYHTATEIDTFIYGQPLSTPGLFPPDVRRYLPKQAPETVNTNTPPKTMLRELYRLHTGRNYKETVNGPDLFSRLSPVEAYAKCPNLKALLNEMLQMACDVGL